MITYYRNINYDQRIDRNENDGSTFLPGEDDTGDMCTWIIKHNFNAQSEEDLQIIERIFIDESAIQQCIDFCLKEIDVLAVCFQFPDCVYIYSKAFVEDMDGEEPFGVIDDGIKSHTKNC